MEPKRKDEPNVTHIGRSSDRQSLVQLANQLSAELTELIRKEAQLARTELSEKVDQVKRGGISIGIGSSFMFIGAQVAVATVVLILATFMAAWLSAFLVTAVLFIIGAIYLSKGKSEVKPTNLTPENTLDSLRHAKVRGKETTHDTRSA